MSIAQCLQTNNNSRRNILFKIRTLVNIPGKDDLTIPHTVQKAIEGIAAVYEAEVVKFGDFMIAANSCNDVCDHLDDINRHQFFTRELLLILRENLLKRDPMMVLSEVPTFLEIRNFLELKDIIDLDLFIKVKE